VLFPRMHDQGMSIDSGPLGLMLAEHELGRQYSGALRSAALEMQDGDTSAISRAIQSARNYVGLLRQHILKEDQILFPMADQVIPKELHVAVWEDFENIEHLETGEVVHEKYLALAEALEAEMAG
jgi:hemerythrin-like domain-containing protein